MKLFILVLGFVISNQALAVSYSANSNKRKIEPFVAELRSIDDDEKRRQLIIETLPEVIVSRDSKHNFNYEERTEPDINDIQNLVLLFLLWWTPKTGQVAKIEKSCFGGRS
jgi:hypothetical protein